MKRSYYEKLPGGGRSLFASSDDWRAATLTDLKVTDPAARLDSSLPSEGTAVLPPWWHRPNGRGGGDGACALAAMAQTQVVVADAEPEAWQLDGIVWTTK